MSTSAISTLPLCAVVMSRPGARRLGRYAHPINTAQANQ